MVVTMVNVKLASPCAPRPARSDSATQIGALLVSSPQPLLGPSAHEPLSPPLREFRPSITPILLEPKDSIEVGVFPVDDYSAWFKALVFALSVAMGAAIGVALVLRQGL